MESAIRPAMTFDTVFDWLEAQVTGGNEISMDACGDGRMQFQLTERSESEDKDVTTITYYRGRTLLDAIRLAMEEHE